MNVEKLKELIQQRGEERRLSADGEALLVRAARAAGETHEAEWDGAELEAEAERLSAELPGWEAIDGWHGALARISEEKERVRRRERERE